MSTELRVFTILLSLKEATLPSLTSVGDASYVPCYSSRDWFLYRSVDRFEIPGFMPGKVEALVYAEFRFFWDRVTEEELYLGLTWVGNRLDVLFSGS